MNVKETAEVAQAPARAVDARRSARRAPPSRATVARAEPATPRCDPGAWNIERLCAEHGLKITGQRRVVARVLSEATNHPDVEEVYRRAALLDERISIATVYRTVRLFEEKGIVHRRDFGSGRARYEPTDHGHHHHLIDVETGSVVEFSDPEHERLIRAIAERLDFDLLSLRLELFGRRREARPSPAEAPAGRRAEDLAQ
jgi:Fur family transcriptional regulator, ferric uptake regulator